MVAEVARLVGDGAPGGVDFEALERACRDAALGIMGRMVANRLNADRGDTRGSAACRCGADASDVDRRAKTFTTVLGSMTLERAWYHCPACGRGFSPRDRALGLENASLSPAVRRMVGIAAGEMSFGHASAALRELAGLEVGAKQVERHAEALGRDIARDELEVVDPEPAAAKTLYVGLDGTGVPMRKSETAGRVGKQADGSAKTREVKLVTVWSAEGRDKDGLPCRDPGSGSCNGSIESIATRDTDHVPSLFAKRVLRELERRCVDLVARRVVLGDGAPWIWNVALPLCCGGPAFPLVVRARPGCTQHGIRRHLFVRSWPFPSQQGEPSMFEQLFRRPGTIERYASAPLVDRRVGYLAHCAASGARLSTLRKIANHQIEAVRLLNLREGDRVDLCRIEAAAGEWSLPRPRLHGGPASPGGEAAFAAHTVRWLRFLGWLEPPERERHPNAARIAEFAGWMRRERGLSEHTIRGRRCAAEEFLGWLEDEGLSLETLRVAARFFASRKSGTGARRTWPGRSCRPASTWARRCRRAWPGRTSSACWRRPRASGPGTSATAPSSLTFATPLRNRLNRTR